MLPMVPSPLSWAETSWTSGRLLEHLLPEKKTGLGDQPPGPLNKCSPLTLHSGARNQTWAS